MDTDNFILYIITYDICKDMTKAVEAGFNTSNYELNRPLPNGKRWKNHDKSFGIKRGN